jgi:hypothetical protein
MGEVDKKQLDRRQFLKKGGAVATLAGLFGIGYLLGHSQVKAIPPITQPWNTETMQDNFGYLIWVDNPSVTPGYLAKNGQTGTNDYSTESNGNEASMASLLQDVIQNAV